MMRVWVFVPVSITKIMHAIKSTEKDRRNNRYNTFNSPLLVFFI